MNECSFPEEGHPSIQIIAKWNLFSVAMMPLELGNVQGLFGELVIARKGCVDFYFLLVEIGWPYLCSALSKHPSRNKFIGAPK